MKKTKRWREVNSRYIIYELKGVFFTSTHVFKLVSSPRRVQMCRGKSYVAAKRRTCRLRLKKEGLAGREPTTCGFERQRLTPTPRRPGVSCISYYCREEPIYNRSEWGRGKALALKTIGLGFAPRQRFLFFHTST